MIHIFNNFDITTNVPSQDMDEVNLAGSDHCSDPAPIKWNHIRKDVEALYCKSGWPLRKVIQSIQTRFDIELTYDP